MTRLIAYEIFGNPADLHIVIGQERAGGKYAILFCRGPGHKFKLMLESEPYFDKAEDAVPFIKETLELVCDICAKDAVDPKSPLATMFPNMNRGADENGMLNANWIAWIVSELTEKNSADTYTRSDYAKATSQPGGAVPKSGHTL